VRGIGQQQESRRSGTFGGVGGSETLSASGLRGWGDGVSALPILGLAGNQIQAHLFADGAGKKATHLMSRPVVLISSSAVTPPSRRSSVSTISVLLPSRGCLATGGSFSAVGPSLATVSTGATSLAVGATSGVVGAIASGTIAAGAGSPRF